MILILWDVKSFLFVKTVSDLVYFDSLLGKKLRECRMFIQHRQKLNTVHISPLLYFSWCSVLYERLALQIP